jgi:hypothetical protein
VDERTVLKWILKKYGGNVWDGFISLRVLISGRLFLDMVMNIQVP